MHCYSHRTSAGAVEHTICFVGLAELDGTNAASMQLAETTRPDESVKGQSQPSLAKARGKQDLRLLGVCCCSVYWSGLAAKGAGSGRAFATVCIIIHMLSSMRLHGPVCIKPDTVLFQS